MAIERNTPAPGPIIDEAPPPPALLELMADEGLEEQGIAEEDGVEITEEDDGGATVDLDPASPAPEGPGPEEDFYANLADYIEEDELDQIGRDVAAGVRADKESLKEWNEIIADGMKLLGFKVNNLEEAVFENACTATHPVLAESIVKYQAKARSQILPPGGPVKSQIMGKKTPDKEGQAQRVREFMNYQITGQMPEYHPEHDRMLFIQGFAGMAFTKMYFDGQLNRPATRFIRPQKFITDYHTQDLDTAYRYTEVLDIHKNDLRRYQLNGFYRTVELGASPAETDAITEQSNDLEGRTVVAESGTADSGEEVFQIYEVHTYLALDVGGDRTPEETDVGLELPYVVTIDAGSEKVLAIRRNWRQGDPAKQKRVWYVAWPFIPGFGFYGYGYIHLIGGLTKASTASMRQLIDAGSFASLPAGFKAHGLRVLGGNAPLKPGEWRDANAPGMDLAKALVPLPYREPSATLFNLLQFVSQAAQKFADSTEQVVSESTNYGPVGTTLALLEASGRLFSAIHERLFESQKRELALLAEINWEFLPESYPYEVVGGASTIFRQDFDGRIDVIPVTDPRAPTEAHRLARANATMTIAGQFPQYHNLPEILKDMHTIIGVEDVQRYLLPIAQPPKPADPITENMNMLTGKGVVSGMDQNHDAHIKVHMVLMENPQYAGNPTVQQAAQAHIQEHLAHKFAVEMQTAMGMQLPQGGQQVPPEVQGQIAQAAAAATEVLSQKALDESMNDPVIMLQMAELKLREQELALKKYDTDKDAQQAAADRLMELKMLREKIAADLKKTLIQAKATRDRQPASKPFNPASR